MKDDLCLRTVREESLHKTRHIKVLIINDHAAVIGGAERFLDNLMHEAEKNAIDYCRLDVDTLLEEGGRLRKSNYIATRYNRIKVMHTIVALMARRMREIKPDLIHLNNNHLYTNSVIRALKDVNIPVVWFVHDHFTLRQIRSSWFLQPDHTITFLTHSPEIYEGLRAMHKKVHLVKVPFNYKKWAIPFQNNIRHRPIDLLFVGRIEKLKGIFTLVRAVNYIKEKLPSISLTILGDGTQLKALNRMIKANKLTANIHVPGGLTDDNVLKRYYSDSRIFVFPSAIETLGYAGLEAQACGTPVIAFENEGTNRWCRDNDSGFVVSEQSAKKLAEKVLEIFHDEEMLTRISTKAKERIRLEMYNASTKEIPDIYKTILSW